MVSNRFYSNGKLMLSGEYLVLAGATALALPVKYGQHLSVDADSSSAPLLSWKAFENETLWFSSNFRFASSGRLKITKENNALASRLSLILGQAMAMNPGFLRGDTHWRVRTDLDFDRNWGLGSSSTLISNVASWAGIDPYPLLFRTLGGSGYDIACARSDVPVLYRYHGAETPPDVRPSVFDPPFHSKLFFIYSGSKQSSAKSLAGFDPNKVDSKLVIRLDAISHELNLTKDLTAFQELLTEHESITGRAIGKIPVQHMHFADFDGVVKSLGAWGGDFLLAASGMEASMVHDYFRSRGYHIIIPYKEMVL
jgi:mevalonate kinase